MTLFTSRDIIRNAAHGIAPAAECACCGDNQHPSDMAVAWERASGRGLAPLSHRAAIVRKYGQRCCTGCEERAVFCACCGDVVPDGEEWTSVGDGHVVCSDACEINHADGIEANAHDFQRGEYMAGAR